MTLTAFSIGDRVKVGLEALSSSVASKHYGRYGTVVDVAPKEVSYPYTVQLDDGQWQTDVDYPYIVKFKDNDSEAFAARELLPV